MIRADLPAQLELTCPECGAQFSLAAKLLHGQGDLHCPLCARQFNFYDGLSGAVRRKVYHAVRDAIEQRVFEQYQMNRSDYFEDWGNIVSGEH